MEEEQADDVAEQAKRADDDDKNGLLHLCTRQLATSGSTDRSR